MIAVVLIAVIVLLNMKTEASATISALDWSREIELEKYQSSIKNDWKEDVPLKGTIQNCIEKERDTKKIEDGQKCTMVKNDNGDGTFSEKEDCKPKYKEVPVYDSWCSYQIQEWKLFDTARKTGSDLYPEWPSPNIEKCSIVALNCERLGRKIEKYNVHFTDQNGKKHSCSFSESKWKAAKIGSSHTMAFNSITGSIDCDSFGKQ